jgi:hypothetical protein
MRIGSIAKLITAAGMMRLHEQGKLSLDTPITEYVNVWPKSHVPISLMQDKPNRLRMGLCAESIAPTLSARIMRPVASTSSQ